MNLLITSNLTDLKIFNFIKHSIATIWSFIQSCFEGNNLHILKLGTSLAMLVDRLTE